MSTATMIRQAETGEVEPVAPAWAREWRELVDLPSLLETGLRIVVILALSWIAYRMLLLLLRRIERAATEGDPNSASAQQQRVWTLLGLVRSVGMVFIAVIALFMILNAIGIDIGPLLAGAGIFGLAISFGAQSLVKDVISGLFILVENQFGVGDVIRVNDLSGRVQKITLRIVTMRDDHGVIHIVPNGEIKQVSNLTRAFSRAILDIGVAYSEDVDRVIHVMRAVAADLWSDPLWRPLLTEEISVPGVESFTETAVNIRIVATTLPLKQLDVARELRRRLKMRFDAEKIDFPNRSPSPFRYPPSVPDRTGPQGEADGSPAVRRITDNG